MKNSCATARSRSSCTRRANAACRARRARNMDSRSSSDEGAATYVHHPASPVNCRGARAVAGRGCARTRRPLSRKWQRARLDRGNRAAQCVDLTNYGETRHDYGDATATGDPLAGGRIYSAGWRRSIRVTRTQERCADDMSGASFDHSFRVEVGGKTYRGCGERLGPGERVLNDPAAGCVRSRRARRRTARHASPPSPARCGRASSTRSSAGAREASAVPAHDRTDDLSARELLAVLDEEVGNLPTSYRVPATLIWPSAT